MTAPTLTLADFLLARIAEDEADARLLQEQRAHLGQPALGGSYVIVPFDEAGHPGDPARVLADCEVRRQIVLLHRREWNGKCASCAHEGEDYGPEDEPLTTCDSEPYPCPTLRALALPYALQWREEQQP